MPDEEVGRTGYDILLKQITGLDTRLTSVQEQLKALDAKMDIQSAGLTKIMDTSLPAIAERLEKVALIDQRLSQAEGHVSKIQVWIEGFWTRVLLASAGISAGVKWLFDLLKK